jgi:hypothetical protein
MAYYMQKFNDAGTLGYEPVLDVTQDDLLNTNLARATRTSNFEWQNLPELAGNTLYMAAKMGLALYGQFPKMNNWIAASAALDVGYEKGLRGDALESYALGLKDRMAVSGGRANKPMIFANVQGKIARPAVGMASLLTTYGLGMTTMMATTARDAIMKTPGLTKEQQTAAKKAAGNAFVIQMLLSGALGLPLAGALIYVIENTFDVDAEHAIRQFLKFQWLGLDDKLGNTVSDVAMNGWLNALTGADFSSRTGLNSLFGVNGYNGFDPWGVAGPVAATAKDAYTSAHLAAQGQFGKAAQQIAPDGLKNLLSLYNSNQDFGDGRIVDNSNNMIMQPSKAEVAGMALGFSPAESRRRKQEARLIANSNKRYLEVQNRQMDEEAMKVIRGEPDAMKNVVRQAVVQSADNPLFDKRAYVQNVVDRVLDMAMEKDATVGGPVGNQRKIGAIAGNFNSPRTSDFQRLVARDALYKQVGYVFDLQPASQQEMLHARLADEIVTQRGYTRQQAREIATKILTPGSK